MGSKRHPKPLEIEARGCLWRKKMVGEMFTKHVKKQASEKYELMSKMYPKKVPRKVIFLMFFGVWVLRRSRVAPRVTFGTPGWSQSGRGGAPGWPLGLLLVPQGGPKGSFWHPQISHGMQKCFKMAVTPKINHGKTGSQKMHKE